MIRKWLGYHQNKDTYIFKLISVTEKSGQSPNLIKYLQKEILTSYRQLDFYKFHYQNESEDKLKKYIEDYVIPSDKNRITKNVKQGDWGEILAALIVMYFQNLYVPIHKLRWKFNKDRSVFSTDMIAHNKDGRIKDIYYYEIKTRQSPQNKEYGKYISVIAHNSLLKDEQAPTEAIVDFLSRYYYEKGDYSMSLKYGDIVKNPQNYIKNFELFLIVEKDNFINQILTDLNELPPQLKPLRVTVVYVKNLTGLVNDTWKEITEEAVRIVKG
jgi:hypothetical protein